MNKLILKILPQIEKSAASLTRNPDLRNEIIQATILKCYDYQHIVKEIEDPKKLNGWIYQVAYSICMTELSKTPLNLTIDIQDTTYIDKLEELKPFLTSSEQSWLKAYVNCKGNMSKIERLYGINRKLAKREINKIIEKCKRLKDIL